MLGGAGCQCHIAFVTADLKLDAYIRVSKVAGRAGDSFISPGVQRERIESWAQAHGTIMTWHEPELDVSGGTMSRPIFDRIMQRVRAGQTDGVIVAKLDRFARTLVGALSTLEDFERQGAVLVTVADNLDLSTPMGKAFLRILLVFAELERDRISESWKTATSSAVERGIHIAKFTPIGYDKGADKRLVLRRSFKMVHILDRGALRLRRKLHLEYQSPSRACQLPQDVVLSLLRLRHLRRETEQSADLGDRADYGVVAVSAEIGEKRGAPPLELGAPPAVKKGVPSSRKVRRSRAVVLRLGLRSPGLGGT